MFLWFFLLSSLVLLLFEVVGSKITSLKLVDLIHGAILMVNMLWSRDENMAIFLLKDRIETNNAPFSHFFRIQFGRNSFQIDFTSSQF